jgi:chromosome segregation ATPase
MTENSRDSFEKRAQRAILENAFFRWESAVVIGLTLVLTTLSALPFVDIPVEWWMWLLGGGLAEALLVYSSYADPEANRQVVANMLKREFKPERLKDKRLQQQVDEALDYRSRITAAIRDRRDTVLRDNLADTARQIDEWLENIFNLAQRLDRFQQEQDILARDKKRAHERIRQLRPKLEVEQDPAVVSQIEVTIKNLERQLQTIGALENTMERAHLQLETTLASLGTIYSQTMLVGAKDIDSARAKRLRQEIADEVHELDDVLLAMDEVYSSSSQAAGLG